MWTICPLSQVASRAWFLAGSEITFSYIQIYKRLALLTGEQAADPLDRCILYAEREPATERQKDCDGLPQRLVQFRSPSRRIRTRLRADEVAFPKPRGRFVPLSHCQLPELAPGVMKALIGAVVGHPRHPRRRQLAGPHSANRGDRGRDGHADLEVEQGRMIHVPMLCRGAWVRHRQRCTSANGLSCVMG